MLYQAKKETISLCIKLLNKNSLLHKDFLKAYKNDINVVKIALRLCVNIKKIILLSKKRKLTDNEVNNAVKIETMLIKIALPVLKGRYKVDTEDDEETLEESDENINDDNIIDEPPESGNKK